MERRFCFLFIFTLLLTTSLLAQDNQKIWGNDRKAITVFTDERYEFNASWLKLGKTNQDRIEKLIELLKKSSTGQKIYSKAKANAIGHGHALEELIIIGESSLTDTTLIRRYLSTDMTKVNYETRSLIHINRSHNLQDAVLDLAHELTHYSFRSAFNPYLINFNLKDFIKNTIEGRGGEVDAYLIECKVFKEIFSQNSWQSSNCARLVDDQGQLSREKIMQKFYQVGNHLSDFKKELGGYQLQLNDFPQVTTEEAQYISSAYGVPYPLAALREYASIMQKSCVNDYKRLSKNRELNGRRPAALNEIDERQGQMVNEFHKRCANYFSEI